MNTVNVSSSISTLAPIQTTTSGKPEQGRDPIMDNKTDPLLELTDREVEIFNDYLVRLIDHSLGSGRSAFSQRIPEIPQELYPKAGVIGRAIRSHLSKARS